MNLWPSQSLCQFYVFIGLLVNCSIDIGIEKSCAQNVGPSFVVESDPSVVTHAISSEGITLGLNANGGGYVNYLDLGDGNGNATQIRFDGGMQSAIRDDMHGQIYAMVQGGFTGRAGTPVNLEHVNPAESPTGGEMINIPRFALPVFDETFFDWVEHEDLAPDWHLYNDGGNSDDDGTAESGLTQIDEIRSEWDYAGHWEDASVHLSNPIPAFRHNFFYEYRRTPQQIYQFDGGTQTLPDGSTSPVFVPERRFDEISPKELVGDPTDDVDMSWVGLQRMHLPIAWDRGYHTAMWQQSDGSWGSRELISSGPSDKGDFNVGSQDTFDNTTPNLMILSTGTSPSSSDAVGIFHPKLARSKQVFGMDPNTGAELYAENRRMTWGNGFETDYFYVQRCCGGTPIDFGGGVVVDNDFIVLVSVLGVSGMFAPGNGSPDAIEQIRQDGYMLFGTPDEIVQAAAEIETSLYDPGYRHNGLLFSDDFDGNQSNSSAEIASSFETSPDTISIDPNGLSWLPEVPLPLINLEPGNMATRTNGPWITFRSREEVFLSNTNYTVTFDAKQRNNIEPLTMDVWAGPGNQKSLNLETIAVSDELTSYSIEISTLTHTELIGDLLEFRLSSSGPQSVVDNVSITAIDLAYPGDFNFDGFVDGNDFLIWQKGESPDPWSASDLSDWELNYGWSRNMPPAVATVPEPGISSVALLISLILSSRRRHWK